MCLCDVVDMIHDDDEYFVFQRYLYIRLRLERRSSPLNNEGLKCSQIEFKSREEKKMMQEHCAPFDRSKDLCGNIRSFQKGGLRTNQSQSRNDKSIIGETVFFVISSVLLLANS